MPPTIALSGSASGLPRRFQQLCAQQRFGVLSNLALELGLSPEWICLINGYSASSQKVAAQNEPADMKMC